MDKIKKNDKIYNSLHDHLIKYKLFYSSVLIVIILLILWKTYKNEILSCFFNNINNKNNTTTTIDKINDLLTEMELNT